jgi:hypothetical protein
MRIEDRRVIGDQTGGCLRPETDLKGTQVWQGIAAKGGGRGHISSFSDDAGLSLGKSKKQRFHTKNVKEDLCKNLA